MALGPWAQVVEGASVGQNLGGDESIVDQYVKNPAGYPICKAGMDYSHIWNPNLPAARTIFRSNKAIIEIGMYTLGGQYTGEEVVKQIRRFEDNGFKVCGVFLYREEWLKGGMNSPCPDDWRILSEDEIHTVREAINRAHLRDKDIKLIQLLGAGAPMGQSGPKAQASKDFTQLSEKIKTFLKDNFDGVGTECHIGMEQHASKASRLDSMVAISKWAKDNDKIALLFMGGMPQSYTDLAAAKETYNYLWTNMANVGVDKKSPHLIYWRQAARPGDEVPESKNTLTQQQAWLIGQVHSSSTPAGNPSTSPGSGNNFDALFHKPGQ